jgi:hypothetical protein
LHRKRRKVADQRDEGDRNERGGGRDETNEALLQKKGNANISSKSGVVCDVCGELYKTIQILKAHMQLHGKNQN